MITTLKELEAAPKMRVFAGKSIASSTTGSHMSSWIGSALNSSVVAGAIPTTPAICNGSLVGAIPLPNAPAGMANYFHSASVQASGGAGQLHDRLAHMGGLSTVVNTVQTVNLDVTGSASNLVDRRGAADYSDVQWFAEAYVLTGAGGSPTLNFGVTYDDGSTDTCSIVLTGSPQFPVGRLVPIYPNVNGRYIRSIQTAQFSPALALAGNVGVTATRLRGTISPWEYGAQGIPKFTNMDWPDIGFRRIANDACLFWVGLIPGGPLALNAQIVFARG